MKQRARRARAVVHNQSPGQKPPKPALCPLPRRTPVGAGLIFAGPDSDAADADSIRKAALVWAWCEWLRMSLVVAALVTAGVVMSAKTVAERSFAKSGKVPSASSASATRSPERRTTSSTPAVIGAIRYSSDDHSTTVTVDLPSLVFFEAHRLSHPDRIYFDLQQTRMPAELDGRPIQVAVGETFLRAIRVAQRGPEATRVVLETKQNCAYSAMIAPDPYRLVVKLRAPDAGDLQPKGEPSAPASR